MKKIFTLFAALAMVMSMSAAKLYLTPNSNWNNDNARFAAYFFDNGEKWISMTKVAGETNLYEVEAPAGYPKVIFCRMNPSAAANNWGNKWNQTDDLTIPTDGKNHYTVKEGTWSNGGGDWTIWPVPAAKNYVDVTITVTANAAASIKWHSAGDKLANATDYVAMNAGENNTYTYTLAQVDDFSGVKYTIKVGDVVSEEQTTSTNVTADFKTLMKQAFLKGSMNEWGDKGKMTIADDYLTASIVLSLNAGSYEWKMYVGVDWLGGGKTVTRENNTHKLTDGDNCKLTADIKGNYTFTWTYATNTLTVTYPAQTITLSYDITAENIGNRQGRQTISVEDENYGNPQLVIPGFNEEVAEYTGAFLAINDTTLNATVTYTKEDGKEIYAATAMDGSTVTIYNVTFTYVLPTTQNYELYAMGLSATVESEEGFTTYYLKGNAILGEEYVPVEFMLDNMGNAEGTIGEVFAVGTGEAEQEGTSLYGAVLLQDESGNTYRIEFTAEVEQPEVEIVVKEEVNVALYNLIVDAQGNMAMVTAEGETLSFWLTLLETENYYGTYTNDAFSNIWYDGDQLYAAYGDTHVYAEVDGKAKFVVSFISTPDAEGNVTKYNFTLYAGEKPLDPTALDNLNTTVAPVKMIENGQLIIVKDGVQYNAQGAILK